MESTLLENKKQHKNNITGKIINKLFVIELKVFITTKTLRIDDIPANRHEIILSVWIISDDG